MAIHYNLTWQFAAWTEHKNGAYEQKWEPPGSWPYDRWLTKTWLPEMERKTRNTVIPAERIRVRVWFHRAMKFSVGTILRNKITKQQGRVIRLADFDGEMCYIVLITRDAARGAATGLESLWREEEGETVSSMAV